MTATEVAFPVGATTQELVDKKGTTYDVSDHTVTRTGEDGAIPILHLFVGDSFEGEILEGGWRKAWDSDMDADQAFVAKLDTANGELDLLGEADVAGVTGNGSISQNNPVLMIEDSEITVSLMVPVDDTGAVADRDITFDFVLKKENEEDLPSTSSDFIRFRIDVDESGLILRIQKNINGAGASTLASGYDYTMDTSRSTGDLEACIWRIVFNGKPGTSGATMSVYLKQSDTLSNADSATEHEVTGSPFDISDLTFHLGYPCFEIRSQNTSYFDDASPATSGGITVKYPQFDMNWGDDTITDDGSVKLFDGDPDSGGVRVYSKDHTFTDSEIYLQNGLVRLKIDELVIDGFNLYGYYGSAWNLPIDRFNIVLVDDSKDLRYPELKSIKTDPSNPEKIILTVRLHEDAVSDTDYYADIDVTMFRGVMGIKLEPVEVFPTQDIRIYGWNTPVNRFGYTGNDGIGDDDLNISASNSVLDDNFIIAFDDDQGAVLVSLSATVKPTEGTASFQALDGGDITLRDYSGSEFLNTIYWIHLSPFSDIANLFKEAEDATISASAREYIDAEHWGFTDDSDMVTDAQPESGASELDGDDYSFWTAGANTTRSQETTIVKVGSESTKIVTSGGEGNIVHDYGAGNGQDFSTKDYIGFWWYGDGVGTPTINLQVYDDPDNYSAYHSVTVDWSGWKWVCFKRSSFTDPSGIDWSDIRYIYFTSLDDGHTWYLDGLVVPYDGLWSETTNCTVEINETDSEVGTYVTKITSNALGSVICTVTPTSGLKLTKFDSLKYYIKYVTSSPYTSRRIRIYDGDGDYVETAFNLSSSYTQYTLDLPHSATDLQGWTNSGFDFDQAVDHIVIRWSANGAGEIVQIDDLHFYIGTTTSRGRGETLSGGEAAVLDADAEYVNYKVASWNDELPEGRYLALYKAKDTDQVANDAVGQCYNVTDSKYLSQQNADVVKTLTSSFDYYPIILDIKESENIGDNINLLAVVKNYATENTILVDYILVIPLSDGMNLPMDLAHNALYDINTETPVDIDSLKTDYIGIKQDGAINFFGGLQQMGESLTLDDDETYNLPCGVNGFGFIQIADNEEYAWFFFNKDGEVTLAVNSANVDDADTDGKFCIYDGGDYVVLKNRLGSTRKIRYMTWSE